MGRTDHKAGRDRRRRRPGSRRRIGRSALDSRPPSFAQQAVQESIGDEWWDELPPWERVGFDAVANAVDSADVRLESGTVAIVSAGDGGVALPFSTLDQLRAELITRADRAVRNTGWPAPSADYDIPDPLEGIVDSLLAESGIRVFFESRQVNGDAEKVVDLADLVAPGMFDAIRLDICNVNAELVAHLARHPELMRELPWRKLEELVAELMRGQGYDSVLTPGSNDGGFDIAAYRKEPYGTILTLVEVKQRPSLGKIGVEVVRGLYGVVNIEGANRGMIATTSSFTKGAIALHRRIEYRMSLANFATLTDWCRGYRRLS
jgi:hypothetical protein